MARSLIFHSNVPLRLWGESVKTTAYLINRTPSKNLGYKTPYELLHNKLPDLSFLRIFGCLAFATVLNSSDKFLPRSEPCILWVILQIKKAICYIMLK